MAKHGHHAGLAHHLQALREATLRRRDVMRWAVGTGLVSLIGCGDDDDSGGSAAGASAAGGQGGAGGTAAIGGTAGRGGGGAAGGGGSCNQIPEETEGPYPADGSNSASSSGMPGGGQSDGRGGPPSGNSGEIINALTISGIMRSDIRSSVGTSTTTAPGVPLTVHLRILDFNDSCKPLSGAAVYIWHCDRSGNYSLYAQSISNENYLRGVQFTDSDGNLTFKTIFPACYSGRWPHIHYEVYPSIDKATGYSNKIATSQIAMPQAECNEVFATDGYETSVTNLQMVTLMSDMVFSDSYQSEQPDITGNVNDGYVIDFSAAVKAG